MHCGFIHAHREAKGRGMKIQTWHEGMSDKETADLAYWERNMLALLFADGWYNDDIEDIAVSVDKDGSSITSYGLYSHFKPRFEGWRRVLSLSKGAITFHIPDDFDVGKLRKIQPNWDGHTTEQKWRRVAATCGVKLEDE